MSFEELTQRLHAVMDNYKISYNKDLSFLSEIAWIFDIEIDFKLTPKEAIDEQKPSAQK